MSPRGHVLERFPEPPGRPADVEAVLARIADAYVADAYHSLSIEGSRVSPALIGPFTDFLAELVASNPAARGG